MSEYRIFGNAIQVGVQILDLFQSIPILPHGYEYILGNIFRFFLVLQDAAYESFNTWKIMQEQ